MTSMYYDFTIESLKKICIVVHFRSGVHILRN
jgi:hypothetical protein